MSSVPERGEVEVEYKWDLSDLYESDEEWEAAFAAVQDRVEDIEAYEGRVTDDGETLLAALELRDDVRRELEKVVNYARLRSAEDTRNQEYQGLSNRARTLASEVGSAGSYVEPAIQSVDREDLDAMVAETPGLERYDHYLDDVHRLAPHTRSAEVENLLAELVDVTDAAGEVYNMLLNADLTFPSVEQPDGETVEVTQSNFTTLQKDPDRAFRREVYEVFYDEFADLRNTIATAYKNSVVSDVKLARARNYETAREAAMNGPNIPVEVYDNLVETVRGNLDPLHRHAELKREFLGVDDLQMWDLYMPMVDGEEPTIDYEEARGHVVDALAPLGEAYQQRVREGLDARWVDVYENRGKRSGAFSATIYDSQPYVLMNFQDDLSSTFTLAHELGHSMHSLLTSEHQPYVYSNYAIFVAEVASMVNETLLTHHLLDAVEDDRFRRYILNEFLERFRGTLFRQTMFADFEHRTHREYEEGRPLTADRFDDIYGDLKAEFYEPATVDDRIPQEWMRIPHFYSAFYVYQYSTGMSAAVSLARDIIEEGEPAAERYREFLRRGSEAYPIELLADAGVDMRSPEPVRRAIDTYGDYLDEMAALL